MVASSKKRLPLILAFLANYTAGYDASQDGKREDVRESRTLLTSGLNREVTGHRLAQPAQAAEVLAVDLDLDSAAVCGRDGEYVLRLERLGESGLRDPIIDDCLVGIDG